MLVKLDAISSVTSCGVIARIRCSHRMLRCKQLNMRCKSSLLRCYLQQLDCLSLAQVIEWVDLQIMNTYCSFNVWWTMTGLCSYLNLDAATFGNVNRDCRGYSVGNVRNLYRSRA